MEELNSASSSRGPPAPDDPSGSPKPTLRSSGPYIVLYRETSLAYILQLINYTKTSCTKIYRQGA